MAPDLDPLLERWIARFRGPLVGLLASWGEDWGHAEEFAMDTFAEAWLGRARLRGDPEDSAIVGPWLRGIAKNLARSHRRGFRRQQPLPAELPADLPGPTEATSLDEDRLELLRDGFRELRPEHQTVLRMFYLEEASTREVAALLDVTEKAVESRLYHARRALRTATDRIAARTTEGVR